MANHDFYVSFGSNLPDFLADTQAQVTALDASIKGIGGALKNLSGIDKSDIDKLNKISEALTGGGAIHIDTRSLDTSIEGLKGALATQLGKFTAALNKAPQPAAPQQGAVLDVDLGPVRESFKQIKSSIGSLKQQAGWLAGHVEGLRESIGSARGHFKDAKKSADSTILRARDVSQSIDSLNEKLKYATDIINRIKFEGPGEGAGTAGAGGGGGVLNVRIVGSDVPIEAQVSGTTAAVAPTPDAKDPGLAAAKKNRKEAEEKATAAANEELKAAKEKAAKVRANAGILEQLLQARREELVLQRTKSRVEARSKGGEPQFTSEREEATYYKALDELAKITERRKSLAKKAHGEEQARYQAANVPTGKRTDDKSRLDALSEAYRAERDARLARANEIIRAAGVEKAASSEKVEAEKKVTKALEDQAKGAGAKKGVAATPTTPAVDPQAQALAAQAAQEVAKASTEEAAAKKSATEAVGAFAQNLKEEADKPAKQLAEGLLEAFQRYIEQRGRTGAEQEAFGIREQAARSGGRNLGADLNVREGADVGLVQKQVMEAAKSVAQLIEDAHEQGGERFVTELTTAFREMPRLMGTAEGPQDPEFMRNLVIPFPEGLPEELASVLARAVKEGAEAEGAEGLEQGIQRLLTELLQALRDRPGEATTASAISVGGKAKTRDYGTFGGDPESRAAIDAAIEKISQYGARMDELNSSLAITAQGLQPDLNPLEDLVPPEAPTMLLELVQQLKARLAEIPAGDQEGQKSVKEEIRSTYALIKARKDEIAAFNSARFKLQEWMVALDDSLRVTKGLSDSEEAYAAVRRQTLDLEKQRRAELSEHQTAKSDIRSAAQEAFARVSVDPNFKDLGRQLPRLDVDRDFPASADTGNFRQAVEEFNQKRDAFIIELARALDIEDPAERAKAFEQTDQKVRGLFQSLDEIYTQRNASVEAELAFQRENLEDLKKGNANKAAIAELEKDIASLEEQDRKNKEAQRRALSERELHQQVPRSPQDALAVERLRVRQQTETFTGGRGAEHLGQQVEGVYGSVAALEVVLRDAVAAFEMLQARTKELPAAMEAYREAIAAADARTNEFLKMGPRPELDRGAEEELRALLKQRELAQRSVDEARPRGGEALERAVEKLVAADKKLTALPEQTQDRVLWDQMRDSVLLHANGAEAANASLMALKQRQEEAAAVLERFKDQFSALFQGRGTVESRPVGERADLTRELAELEAQIKKSVEGLGDVARDIQERRQAIIDDLRLPSAQRNIKDAGGLPVPPDMLRDELRELDRAAEKFKDAFEPIKQLESRRSEVQERLAKPDTRRDLSGVPVAGEDLNNAARLIGEMLNKAIATQLGAKFSELDRRTLSSARGEVGATPLETLANFERAMTEAVVRASEAAMQRLTGTTATQASAAAGAAAQPQLPVPAGPAGPAQSVTDADGNALLRQINDGIRKLIECCERMAAGGAVATATAAKGKAPSPAIQPMIEGFDSLFEGSNVLQQGAKELSGAAKQHRATVTSLVTSAEQFKANVEQAIGRGFSSAQDYVRSLVRGEGVAEPMGPAKAAREAGKAYGIDLVSQEFEDLEAHAKMAEQALKAENAAKRDSTRESRTRAESEARYAERLRQAEALPQNARERILPLVQALIELERQLEETTLSTEERAKAEEAARQKRAEIHAVARGSSGRGGGDALLPEGAGPTRVTQTMIGYKEYKKAGDDAAHMFAEGFQTGIGKAGPKAFSFIDRMLQTTVNMFMRSIASRLTFGLQRQLRTLITTGMETEATFIRVSSAMQATGRSAQGLRGEITRISTSLGVSLNELYEITARLTGVFDDPQDVVRATESIAMLEIISQGQLNALEGYRALSAIQNTFWEDLEAQGQTGEDAFAFINDATVAMQDLTGVNIEDLLTGAAQLGAVTQGLNLGFLETQAIVAKVAQTTGTTGTAAAEKLNRIFANVTDPKFQEALLNMGLASQQQLLDKDFKAIFEQIADADLGETQVRALASLSGGDRQFREATALWGQAAEIVDVYDAAVDSGGRAEERRADLMKELSNQLKILGTNFENFAATLVRSGFLNVLKLVVQFLNMTLTPLNRFLTYLNDMADKSRFAGMIRSLVGVAVGMKLILTIARAMRHEVATAMKLGTVAAAKAQQGVNPRLALQQQQAVPAPPGGMLGRLGAFAGRKGGVEQVEVKNVKELGQAIRFRGEGKRLGMAPLEVARGVDEGTLRHQRLGIGQSLDEALQKFPKDVITQTFPARSLDLVTGKMRSWGSSLQGVGVATQLNNAATARQITGEGLLARSKMIASGAAIRFGTVLNVVAGGLTRITIATASWGRSLMTSMGNIMKGKGGLVVAFAAIAAAIFQARRAMFKEWQEVIDARFAMPEDLDEPDEAKARREKREDLFGKTVGPTATLAVDEWGRIIEGQLGNFRGWEGAIQRGVDYFKSLATRNRADNIRKETETYFEGWRAQLQAIEDITNPADRLAAIEAINEEFSAEDIQAAIDKEGTTTGTALATEAAYALAELTDEALVDALGALRGINDARTLTVNGVGRVRRMMGVVSGLPSGMAAQFSSQIDMLLEAEQIPEAYRQDLMRLAGAQDATSRRTIETGILEHAVKNASANLKAVLESTRSTQPEIDAAKSELEGAVGDLANKLTGHIQEQIEFYKAASQLSILRGGTGVSDLWGAIKNAQAFARAQEIGSAEHVNAELAVIELQRQAAELLNAEANRADSLAAAIARDPGQQLARQLDTAKRNLQTAQRNEGLYTPEQLNQLIIEVTNLEQQIADNEAAIAQAYSNLAKSRTRNPMAHALEDRRFALEELKRAQSLEMGPAEIANRAAAVNQANQSVQDQAWATRDALDALIGGRTTNVMATHTQAIRSAALKLNRAVKNDMGAAAIYTARKEWEDAIRAQAEERRSITEASQDFRIGRIQNDMARARAQAQVNARRMRQARTRYGADSTQYIQAMGAYHDSLEEIATTQQAINAALRQLGIGRAQNAHLDVQAARLQFDDARKLYQEALAKYKAGDARTIQAQQQMEAAQAGVRDAILADAERRIEWQLGMEHITQQQAIAAYQNILNTFELTQRQREDIMLKMKQMQDSINSSIEGQWNIGDIRIPTPYEVRRGMNLDGLTETVTQVTDSFLAMFGGVASTLQGASANLATSGFAPTSQQNINSETTILVNGADTAEVKRILTQILGPQAVGSVTVGSSGTRRL